MSEIYISVDVETAGPIPSMYSMLSIGACMVGKADEQFYIELQPINALFIPEAIKIVGKSLEEFTKSGSEPLEAMQKFRAWILKISEESTPVFVGFNATFDWSFINWYFHTYLDDNPFGFGGVDIKSFYMGLSGCSWKDSRSSRIPDDFKGQAAHTHNALDDALEQAGMFEKMLTKIRN
ncbi:MAG: 3'-5' exonuclease [Pyrinomonadaceae bacterium]